MLWTAFLLGLLGSLHCVGMCGPIVLALPVYKKSFGKVVASRLLYNSGRIISYGLLGALMGLLGLGVALAGYQQKLSVISGVLIILFALGSVFVNQSKWDTGANAVHRFVKNRLGRFLKSRGRLSSFLIGFTNGFLPCGLVYLALGGALAVGTLQGSIFYMMLFGVGTSFSLFALGLFGNFFGVRFRLSFNKWAPYLAFFVGILLVVRGLNLDIPYLSPGISPENEIEVCH